jgi:hypothetical protein
MAQLTILDRLICQLERVILSLVLGCWNVVISKEQILSIALFHLRIAVLKEISYDWRRAQDFIVIKLIKRFLIDQQIATAALLYVRHERFYPYYAVGMGA